MSHPVIETARGWIGTPYGHMGRVPGSILDCLGLLICAGKENGFVVEEIDDYYPNFIDSELLIQRLGEHLEEQPDPDTDHVATVAFKKGKPTHIILVTREGTVIQCLDRRGVIETTYGGVWRNRTTHRFKLPDTPWQP